MRFTKFQGFGNDYIVFEWQQLAEVTRLNDFVRDVCAQHYGAGADGVATIEREANDAAADFRVRIFNADGSEAEVSGNGTRCAAAYLYYHHLWSDERVGLMTGAGLKRYRLLKDAGRGVYWFESELGQPVFESLKVPFAAGEPQARVVDYPLTIDGEALKITALSMGNPHCVIFVDDFAEVDWRSVGNAVETNDAFPAKTNVEFVRVIDAGNIELRIWERGVGETFSSGTCSCASVVASVMNNKTGRRVVAQTPGGHLEIEWRESDNEVVLKGRADAVYTGEWLASIE